MRKEMIFVIVLLLPTLCLGLQHSSCHPENYAVSRSGNDSLKCVDSDSSSRIPCLTLGFLLSYVHNRSCIRVIVSYNQSLTELLTLTAVKNVTISGTNSISAPIYIKCKNESGIVFEQSSNVLLENLHFLGCSARSKVYNNCPLAEYSALYFYQGGDVLIVNCGFHDGSGTGVIMNDLGGENFIRESDFIGNEADMFYSGGLIVRGTVPSLTLDRCYFIENINNKCYFKQGDVTVGLGGGVTFNLTGNTSITIANSRFINNSACQGGGIHVYQQEWRSYVTLINITNSTFHHNKALDQGGGIWVTLADQGYESTLRLNLLDSVFESNTAQFGGGFGIYDGNELGTASLFAKNTMWRFNEANSSGFAIGLSAASALAERPNKETSFHLVAMMESCVLYMNKGTDTSSTGAVYLYGTKADFSGSAAEFWGNNGTAVYLRDYSYARFSGDVTFRLNTGDNGGAIHVDKTSLISLGGGALKFRDNHAVVDGGAIYVEYTSQDEQECVFESLKTILNTNLSESINVTFFNNTAGDVDQSVFIGSAGSCVLGNTNASNVSIEDIILFDDRVFLYTPNYKSQVASLAKDIGIRFKTQMRNGSHIRVMPGEEFYLVPTVKDVFGNDAYQPGNLVLEMHSHFQSTKHFELVGPRFLSLDSYTHNNELSIRAERSMIGQDGLVLEFIYSKHSSYHDGSVSVPVELTECRAGFSFDDNAQQCACNQTTDLLQTTNLLCVDNSYACVRYGYWHGIFENMSITLQCQGINCQYLDGKCPKGSEQCPLVPEFCFLESTDGLCWEGGGGVLCSGCQSNYSLSFAGLKCVPNDTCSAQNTAFFVSGLVIYWVLLVVFMLIILNMDLSVGCGVAYGVMYYFSVVYIFTSKSVTDSFLQTLINTCVAITQLSPRAFGDIPVCFVRSWTSELHHKMFHYVTPLAVIFLIVVVIFVSRRCPCPKSISPAQNTPIHAICLLVLASYTSVTFTNFEILRPVRINGEYRVYADPKLKYFQDQHLFCALIALILELAVSLPICFLILLAPCLSGRVNLVKLRLKPFLDEFQACYRPKCRWFAGFYFLTRQLIFLVNIIPMESQPENNIGLHTINAGIFITYCYFQPYKLKWLNILDAVLLADILFLSFFRLEFHTSILQKIITYLLILPPSLYLALLMVLVFMKRYSYCFQRVKICKKWFGPKKDNFSERRSSSSTPHTKADKDNNDRGFEGSAFFRDSGEREPLLADMEDCDETSSDTLGPKSSRTFTTTSLRLPSVLNQSTAQNKAFTS